MGCMAGEQNTLQPQVFISHTSADEHGRIFAASIVQPALKAAGLTTYIDHADLQLGCAWPAELVKAAATSAVFVVVLTQSYPTRFWCLRELDIVMHGHPDHPTGGAKPYIIPVYMHHHSLLQHLTVEQLRSDIQRRMGELAGDEDSAEWRDLQRVNPERMLRNIRDLKDVQGARRQHQAIHLYATPQEQQQQQQQPAGLFQSNSSSRGPAVPPPMDEEWQIARRVAAAALQQLPAKQRLAYVPPGLVGYEQQLAELTAQLVVDEPGTLGLWLYGPGGLGKTTLAHLLFNTLSSTKQFEKAVMVELDLEGSNSEQLQRHLVQLLQGLAVAEPEGSNAQLLQSLAQLVQQHKVLLLLDNVNHDHQLDGLLPPVFSSGSRVIITSRVQALPGSTVYKALVRKDALALRHHSMDTLDEASARQVFRQCHGVGEQQLQQLGMCDLEEKLLQACSGLPLALQVIGGALWVEEEWDPRKLWQEVGAFSHGEWTPTHMGSSEARLQGVVYHSFSRLSQAAQNMFLDSISVLQGQPLSKAMLVWEAWWPGEAHQALRKLKQLSLISTKTVSAYSNDPHGVLDERLTALDVIRVLGQSILHKAAEYVGSRVWVNSDHAVRGLIEGKQPVGVNLSGCTSADAYSVLQGCNFSAVRIFISHHLPPGVQHHAPHLMWLGSLSDRAIDGFCSDNTSPHKLPAWWPAAAQADNAPCLQTLVVLDLSDLAWVRPRSGIGCPCWRGLAAAMAAVTALPCLRALDINVGLLDKDKLQALFSTLSSCKHLQQLLLHDAEPMRSNSATVRQSWGQFLWPDLQFLLWDHSGELPNTFGELTALRELHCWGQSSLPLPFESMKALQVLHVCLSSADLPEAFGGLAALRQLDLSGSEGLTSLPESFGGLTALKRLQLYGCTGLTSLKDESFRGLAALTFLDLTCCRGLTSLPESFGGLAALKGLSLSHCGGLLGLPKSFSGLVALQVLDLSACVGLTSLPESLGGLIALQELVLSGCSKLSSLPTSLVQLTCLQVLWVHGCHQLPDLPEALARLCVKHL